MTKKGVFNRHKKTLVTYDTKPAPGDMVWIDQNSGIVYNYDLSREKWLSTSKDVFEFARKGNTEGMYLPLLGDLDHAEDVYTTGYESTIVGVFCRSRSGDRYKQFYIRKNGSTIFTFNCDYYREYHNKTLDINIGPYDEINIYVSTYGSKVKNTVCRLDIARRYTI